MVFTKKRKHRKTFKRRPTRKRTFKKRRGTTFKRRHLKRRRHGILGRISAPRLAMNVIPRTADRLHVSFDYKMRGQLSWANTAEQHIGMIFAPTHLGAWNASFGPFASAWPAAGTNILFPHSVSSTPGFFTTISRYSQYYVSSVKITARIVRQEAADSCTCIVGMMPLSATQFSRMILRNTTMSPTANNSYWVPQVGNSATTPATGNICNSQLMTIRQQPYLKTREVSMPYNGKQSAVLSQRYSAKKFLSLGFPFSIDSNGNLPTGPGSDGTPPVDQFYHYFFMQRTAAATPSNEAYDIEFDMQIHCTLHDPGFMQSAPTETQVDPVPADPEMKEEDDDLIDVNETPSTPNLSNLSLTTPRSTCLNPSHPTIPHQRAGTCV